MMKPWIGLLLIFGLSTTIAASETPVALTVTPNWVDLGKLESLEPISHTFTFEVKGGDVTIERIITGCGCTTSKLPKSNYQESEQGQITITFDPCGYNGLVYKEMSVEYRTPELKSAPFSLIANVMAPKEEKQRCEL